MARRADLVFRATQLEKALNIGSADWLTVGEAATVANTSDFYVSGCLVKAWEFVHVDNDGSKTDPQCSRKAVLIKDGNGNAPDNEDHFTVIFWGVYANDFEHLNVSFILLL